MKINTIEPAKLGSKEFKNDYSLKYAYMSGAMFKGISCEKVVVAMGNSGLMGFFGSGGLSLERIEGAIGHIKRELKNKNQFGMNLLHVPDSPQEELNIVDLYLRYGVRHVEASAFMQVTPGLALYRLSGLFRSSDGQVICKNHIVGKISRPEVAESFMRPVPERIVRNLLNQALITAEQAELSKYIPLAQDICVEADSGGHTDRGRALVLLPVIKQLGEQVSREQNYGNNNRIRVGAAGGIGTPATIASAFILGAGFVVTGSINQCTVEADTSDEVKNILQTLNVQDMDYAPAGDMFEFGAKVQVVKKGGFFAARANKLYELYTQNSSLEELNEKDLKTLQEKIFKRSIDEVWDETRAYYLRRHPEKIDQIEKSPKQKMAAIFRWYFVYSTRAALSGDLENKVDFQIHCGPALGAFNQWVKGTELENWRNRHIDKIGELLMIEAAKYLENSIESILS